MKQILILNGGSYARAFTGIADITFSMKTEDFLRNPKRFSMVLFTGGEDVSPQFYGDTSPQGYCSYSYRRDVEEREVFLSAAENNIPMVGICRGVQFLNVMSGGRMMHDISNHGGTIHRFQSPLLSVPIAVNSYHHQMVIPSEDAMVIGTTVKNLSKRYIGRNDEEEKYTDPEVEAIIVSRTKVFGVQYHAEMSDDLQGHNFFKQCCTTILQHGWQKFEDKCKEATCRSTSNSMSI